MWVTFPHEIDTIIISIDIHNNSHFLNGSFLLLVLPYSLKITSNMLAIITASTELQQQFDASNYMSVVNSMSNLTYYSLSYCDSFANPVYAISIESLICYSYAFLASQTRIMLSHKKLFL